MLKVSRRTRYALRAFLELARNHGEGPTPIAEVARRQAVPRRFLEGILNELRKAGLLVSVRGNQGGYLLARHPAEVTVGEVLRVIGGQAAATDCIVGEQAERGILAPDCAFASMWLRAESALRSVFDSTTFSDLLEEESRSLAGQYDYQI